MFIRKKNGIHEENSSNIFWTTMSDLMLGLCIVFITLFVLAMTGYTQTTVKMQQKQAETSKELALKFKDANIKAEVDMYGSVKIADVELFDTGSYQLSSKGKRFLDKFTPIYFETIMGNSAISDNIDNILVQGHTDSQTFRDARTQNEQFSKNMFLSLQRAYAVQNYMLLKTPYNKKYDDKLRKMIVVEGYSNSNPIKTLDGKEDLAKSRRVEIKLKVKGAGIAEMLGIDFGRN